MPHPSTRLLRTIVVGAILTASIGDVSHACSTFCLTLGDRRLFGKNYDFEIGEGLLMVNPAGLRKRGALTDGPEWVVRHGSVTFNQFGRDTPMGGMNEAGLVIELMWHEQAAYPRADARPAVGVLEWIQYQLDTAGTVAEVLKSDDSVRINGQVPLHYLVSDRDGRTATVEFMNGVLVAHSGATLPVPVLTNSTYRDSIAFAEQRKGQTPRGSGSLERFARAAAQVRDLKQAPPTAPLEAAFAVLDSVAQSNTRWSIVYDQTAGLVHFRTMTHRPVRTVTMSRLDFACGAGPRMLDLDARLTGDITAQLRPYSSEAHLALVRKNYAASSVTRRTPPDEVTALATRPEKSACAARP